MDGEGNLLDKIVEDVRRLLGDTNGDLCHVYQKIGGLGKVLDLVRAVVVEGSKKKSKERSVRLREEGNKMYGSGKYSDSLLLYNQSVLVTPYDTCQVEMAMCLTNRSAVLLKYNMYKQAVADLEMAIDMGYPQHLIYKAYQRLGVANERLGEIERARSAYKSLIKSLDFSDIPNQKVKKMQEETLTVLNTLDMAQKKKSIDSVEILKLVSSHPDMMEMSSSLEMRLTEDKGRYLVARSEIEVGEVICKETAAAVNLIPDKRSSHCLYCTKETISPIPCPKCTTSVFCSTICRTKGLTSHLRICQIMSYFIQSNTTSATHMMLCVELMSNHPAGEHIDNENDKKHQTIMSLVSHQKSHLVPECLVILSLLRLVDYTTPEDELDLGRIVLHYLATIQPNVHAVFELSPRPTDQAKTEMVGVAMFPTVASGFNHSCDPNTFVVDIGREQVTIASRHISVGEEISQVYLGHFGSTSRDIRQKQLMNKYNFSCNCEACQDDFPRSEEVLKTTTTFVNTPTQILRDPTTSRELLEDLDSQNQELRNKVEKSLEEGRMTSVLNVTIDRVKLACNYLKQPHALLMGGRMALVSYSWAVFGNRSHKFRRGKLPCYF